MHLAAIENVFFLVLVAIVGLIRWILQAAESKRNQEAAKRAAQQPQANAPIERAPAQSEEERIRRFMEALGVPTAPPPPKKEPRRVTPKVARRTIAPVDPFPKPQTPMWTPEPVIVVTPPPVASSPPAVPSSPPPVPASVATAPQSTAPVYEVQVVAGRAEEIPAPPPTDSAALVRQKIVAAPVTWVSRLASAQGARDAIILREIFGPPRSMQPLDELRAI